MFGSSTLFNYDLLDNMKKLIKEEDEKLENQLKIDVEIFNHSNCQCATEHYEFVTEREFKIEFKNSFKNASMELLIVGLYKQCEIHIKNYVKSHFTDLSKTKQQSYCNLNSELPDFSAIDELRLINNCIKHQGLVSSSLASAYPQWQLNKPMGDLSITYDRLKNKVTNYIIAHEQYIRQLQK